MFSASSYPMLYDLTGSKKSNMAGSKPEVHTFQLLDKIGTQLQRLCLRGPAIQGNYQEYCMIYPEMENSIWRLLNFKYVYLSSCCKYE